MNMPLNNDTRSFYLSLITQCDPLVGDTACQIRAMILMDYYYQLYHLEQFNTLSLEQKEKIAQLIHHSIFLTSFKNLKSFEPSHNPILHTLDKKTFHIIKNHPLLASLLENVNENNYQTYPFSLEECQALKNILLADKKLKKFNEKIEFSELDLQQENVQLLNEYRRQNNQTPITKLNQLKTFFSETKQYIANVGFDYLQEYAQQMRFSEPYQKYIQQKNELHLFFKKNNHKECIPLVPTYLSTQMLLHFVEKNQQVIKLILNVSSKNHTEPVQIELFYQFQQDKFKSITDIPQPICIQISMNIELKTQIPPLVEPCFQKQNIQEFLQEFQNIDIAKLILMCAAAHRVVPEKAIIMNVDAFNQDFTNFSTDTEDRLSEIKIQLSDCLEENYRAFNILAQHYGLFQDPAKITQPIVNITHIILNDTRLMQSPTEESLINHLLYAQGGVR